MKSLFSAVTKILVLAALVLAATFVALAQSPRRLQPNEHATNLAGATTIEAPPVGFDPIAASDEDLAYHGFPPRPNQVEQPKAYATWAKAMSHSKHRTVPSLEQTGIFHGPANVHKNAPTAVESNAAGRMPAPSNTLYSSNWSGYVDFSGASSYGSSSYYYIVNDMIVPVAEQAFGACTGGWDWGSEWNGIDGWGSGDVLQAGVEFDAYCSGSTRSAYYSAWYEWYPYGEVRISSLPVAPGDEVFVEVWHTSSTQGYAYLVNYTTNQSVEVGFTAYPGHPLIGNSAEWVVERPTVGGSVATLTNYTAIPFFDAYAYTSASSFYDIANGNPVDMESGTTVISYPEYTGVEAFVAHY